eukprot:scaffold27180_cov66-Isochrysis_galbana.AAC.1
MAALLFFSASGLLPPRGGPVPPICLFIHFLFAQVICSRPVVALSARVHPGESNSSLMMRGILFFLTGDTDDARALRSRILFLIVPMLNPDGVVVGARRARGARHSTLCDSSHPHSNHAFLTFGPDPSTPR